MPLDRPASKHDRTRETIRRKGQTRKLPRRELLRQELPTAITHRPQEHGYDVNLGAGTPFTRGQKYSIGASCPVGLLPTGINREWQAKNGTVCNDNETWPQT